MAKGNLRKLAARVAGRPAVLSVTAVAGAGANTNIAVAGIRRKDALVSVLELQPPTAGSGNAIAADRTSATSITSDGNIQCTSSTSGNQLLVIWYSLS